MRNKFRYYLKNASGSFYYVDPSGVVSLSVDAVELQHAPIEWKETDLKYSRNSLYHGVFYSFTIPLTFVLDGAAILRSVFYNQELFESVCTFSIEKLDDTSQEYVPFYSGAIDFSTAHDEFHYFSVEILDSGLYALLKANESTPQEIPITPAGNPASIRVHMDGIYLQAGYNYVTIPQSTTGFNSTQMWGLPITSVSKDGAYSVGEQKDQAYISMGTPLGPTWGVNSAEHNNFLYKADQTVSMRLRVNHEVRYHNPSGTGVNYHLETRLYKASSTSGTATLLHTLYNDFSTALTPGSAARQVIINTVSPYFTLVKDERIYYVVYVSGPGSSGGANTTNLILFGQTAIDMEATFRLKESIAATMRPLTLWEQIISKVTNGLYAGVSAFLGNSGLTVYDNSPYHTLVTSGDALRGFGDNAKPAVIKTTLSEFYKTYTSIYSLGIGIERDGSGNEIAVIEPLTHFYDKNTISVTLPGVVNEFNVAVSEEHIYNLLNIGNPNQEYDQLNGRDEPNATASFAFPIIRVKKEWDMVSRYRFDMYGIEYIRANLTGQRTTDAGSDNDTFLIEAGPNMVSVMNTTAYPLQRRQNTGSNYAAGMLYPTTAYNLGLTPKRSLYRNGALIRSALHMQDGKTIAFKTTDKNAELVSSLGSGVIAEKASIFTHSLPDPLFFPLIFQFETQVPTDLPTLIAANPYGLVSFNARNRKGEIITLTGFIDEVGIKPADNATYQWRLICGPDVDLNDLIN